MNSTHSSFVLILILCITGFIQAQEHVLSFQAQWSNEAYFLTPEDEEVFFLDFKGASRWDADPSLPMYRFRLPVAAYGQASLQLTEATWTPWPAGNIKGGDVQRLPGSLHHKVWMTEDRNNFYVQGYLLPLYEINGQVFRLESAVIQINFTVDEGYDATVRNDDTEISVLADGTIYKIAVEKEGIYKLSYDFLKNTVKMPVDQIDPRRIHLYGNGGGMLPRLNAAERPDDLVENAIYIHGQDDGVFNASDYILFYAPGPNQLQYNTTNQQITRQTHLYDTRSYYFLKVEGWHGTRIPSRESLSPEGSPVYGSYTDLQRLEDEYENLLHTGTFTQGSGSSWYGDRLSATLKSIDYTNRFQLNQIVPGTPVQVRAEFVSRSDVQNRFTLNVLGQSFLSGIMSGTNLSNVEARYASRGTINQTFLASETSGAVQVLYTAQGNNATGWVDYVEVQLYRQLSWMGSPFSFSHLDALNHAKSTYAFQSPPSDLWIWDITNPLHPIRQNYELIAGEVRFTAETDAWHRYFAFNPQANLPSPSFAGVVPNQNLHGILEADMLIVYHSDFEAAANRLADHRRQHSGLNVVLANIDEVFNEFASGSRDLFAIRDFARMLYKRDNNFRFLLLFGDASFDHRNLLKLQKHPDFIPVFETDESLDPVKAFPTDDIYGLMGEHEGAQLTGHSLDIAIGRLPVETAAEAHTVVDKIINYDVNPDTYGDWRLRAIFIADDEDNNLHLNDADALAENTQQMASELNLDKIYLDAFKQVATPAGQRYPDANKAFNNAVFRGGLIVSYLGHGGTQGWTQERVVQIEDIKSWTNKDRLPLFLTATCTFAAFDNPEIKTGGEEVLLNPNGGGIALFSTVRPVYASLNRDLANRALQDIFGDAKPYERPIGEILREAKNKRNNGENDRKFLLIGDPAQYLAYPKLKIETTSINGIAITGSETSPVDTLKALQTVTIEGRIVHQDGQPVSDFNGVVYPTLFDKAKQVMTLGNDPGSFPRPFRLQKSTLHKGAASVTNGEFSFTFTLPEVIDFSKGSGKLSYYAWDEGIRDAGGSYENFLVYGVDEDVESDNLPPVVDVFMNGPDWAFGGLTSDRPELYVEMYDDHGFNFSGNSIGQDAIAILNEDNANIFVLNDFFIPTMDDARRGTIRYPLSRLEPGRYSIRVRVWDIFNNPGEGYTEFVVGTIADGALAHVLNFPNPVTDHTYFRFEHNLAGQTIDVSIRIYDMMGREVKELRSSFFADSNRISNLMWDGLDANGSPLPRGMYLYKVHLEAIDGTRKGQRVQSSAEKLVLLK